MIGEGAKNQVNENEGEYTKSDVTRQKKTVNTAFLVSTKVSLPIFYFEN